METRPTREPGGSPVPGVIPEPARVEHEPEGPERDRDRRRAARDEKRRGTAPERAGVMIPNRRSRLPLEAPLMRLVATAGIVGISVAIAAIMGSRGSQGWLIGLVASIVSLALAAVLWSSRRL